MDFYIMLKSKASVVLCLLHITDIGEPAWRQHGLVDTQLGRDGIRICDEPAKPAHFGAISHSALRFWNYSVLPIDSYENCLLFVIRGSPKSFSFSYINMDRNVVSPHRNQTIN